MRNVLTGYAVFAAVLLATSAFAASPDPALGESAKDRHAEMAAASVEGKSATDRHAPGNYYPLD